MPHGRDDALPLDALRDLIGVVRALYRALRAESGHPVTLEDLRTIGSELVEALELARKCDAGTLGHVAAWAKAERATAALGKLVQESMPLKPAVEAAIAGVFVVAGTEAGPERPTREQVRKMRRERS